MRPKDTKESEEKKFKKVIEQMCKGFGKYIKPITKEELLSGPVDES